MDYRKARIVIQATGNNIANRFLNLAILLAAFIFAAKIGVGWGIVFYLVSATADFLLHSNFMRKLNKL